MLRESALAAMVGLGASACETSPCIPAEREIAQAHLYLLPSSVSHGECLKAAGALHSAREFVAKCPDKAVTENLAMVKARLQQSGCAGIIQGQDAGN